MGTYLNPTPAETKGEYTERGELVRDVMKQYALVPLDAQLSKDVQSNVGEFDKWIQELTGGKLSLNDLQMVLAGIPVVGNLIAASDVIIGLYELTQKQEEPGLMDWFGIGVDTIGVIPLPLGLAPLRMTLRPVIAVVKQSVVANKGAIASAVVEVIISHIMADQRVAATVETAVKDLSKAIQPIMENVATFIMGLIDQFALFLRQLSSGELGKYRAVPAGVAYNKGTNFRDAKATKTSIFHALLEIHASARNVVINTISQLALAKEQKEWLWQAADHLEHKISPLVKAKMKDLGDEKVQGGIAHLLKTLLERLAHKKTNKTHGSATPGVKSEAKYRVSQQQVEKSRKLKKAEKAPNNCKSCPITGGTAHSIGFALGEESFSHTDFVLTGVMPIVWARTYNSRLARFDQSSQGARWLTPFHTRFDLSDDGMVYIDDQGRETPYPRLKVGEHHQDRSEGQTLSQLSDKLLTVAHGHELLEIFERHGESYLLAMLRDRAGNEIVLDYDIQGRLSRLRNGESPWALLQYDAHNRISSISLASTPPRQLASYQYNDAGDLISASDEDQQRWQYQYQQHLITRYTDRTGRGQNIEWDGTDAKSKAIREYADDGSNSIQLEYVPDLRLTITTDALAQEIYYYFDIDGYVYRTVYPDGKEEWAFRDEAKNLTKHIHPDGTAEGFIYDDKDNLIEHIRPDQTRVLMAYDDKDQLIRITDPSGHEWLREYDAQGNLTKETDPLGHSTQYNYNPQGLPVAIKDAKGGSKKLAYLPNGQLSSYTDCSGKTSQWQYDARGRLIVAQDAAGNASQYHYGSDGQLAKVVNPDGTHSLLQYDAEGRLLSHTDALQAKTQFDYDRAGRVSSRKDAANQTLNYQYDKLGRLLSLINENKEAYRFTYDAASRLQEETDFGNKRTRYQYEAETGRLQQINEAGKITTLAYDETGRLSARQSGQSSERFRYDVLGRIYAAKNQYSECHFGFDAVGNLITERHEYKLFGQQQQYNWQHEYDELGNRIASIRPDGQRTDWLIYGSGHVHGMLWNKQEIASFERDDLHRETQRILGNQLTAHTHFDKMGRISQQTLTGKTNNQRSYQYDPVGQLLGISDSRSGQISYQYDPVGRLIAANSSLGHESFAFDSASNLVDTKPHAGNSTSSLPAMPAVLGNLLKQYAGTHYKYDARSNLIEKQQGEQTTQYNWDGFNRLKKISNAAGETKYYYDVFGRRIGKENAQGKTEFIWDGDVIALEKTAEHTRHYLFEPNSFIPLAQIVSTNDSEQEHTAYYHVDHLGTPQTLSDENGEIAWSAEYKAWGEAQVVISEAAKTAGINNPIRFQGQYFDEESGLHYNRHRYYDPEIGRFISSDPIGLMGGFNTHAYAPNPVEWIDPLGLAKACCACGDEYVTRSERWEQLANDPNTPSHIRGWVKNQQRQVKLGKQKEVKSPPGYDLSHEYGKENDLGYDYSHAQPATRADHQGVHHRYYRKRGGCFTVAMPKSGSRGTDKLSLPKPGSLPK
ncbi:RHS repeat-associated core domain-containing protein [Iodobacter sp. CM08]|uniref:RHS repeat-associated core domain-containing protein n=1 Tax=Iodobacter sp. CM08 TaxID=3085902 RepID=UPI002981C5AA|nr:RHS repeat-associated core domain-containing protein [Iodobacter sp. CM08]MDW5416633.1 RHS repeat-associated core domain-containing protein [Iodobacter sp. CM08]